MENLNTQNSEVIGYKCKLWRKCYITSISLFASLFVIALILVIVFLCYPIDFRITMPIALSAIMGGYLVLEITKFTAYNKLPDESILKNGTKISFFADNAWHNVDISEIVHTEIKPAVWRGLFYRSLKLSGSLLIRYSNGSTFEVKQLDNIAEVGKKLANRSQSFSQTYIR